MSFQLPSLEDKAEYVHCQFERIAKRYDLANDVISFGMHRLWKNAAIAKLNLKSSGHYLDVCCGTGDLAITMASKLSGVGQITAVDFAENMLTAARSRELKARAKNKALSPITWVAADAQNLPFDSNTFDGAIISFGLRNLTDMQKGLKEMMRVIKPNACLVILDVAQPSLPLFAQAFHIYFHHLVPILGQLIQQDRLAYTYLPESARVFPAPEILSRMLQEIGLSSCFTRKLALGSTAIIGGVKLE